MEETNTPANINLSQLGMLINAVNLAQKRGAYTLQEAAQLAQPVLALANLLESFNKQQLAAEASASTEASVEAASVEASVEASVSDPKTV